MALEIIDLSYKYPKSENMIINELNYSFNSGKIIGVYGKNGSGKTTFLNCLSGLLEPVSGKILYNGINVDKIKNAIAAIPDKSILFPYLTVWENILFFLKFLKISFDEKDIPPLLYRYELYQYRDKYIYESSAGMLKKTQIVISLLQNPKLLLADEPLDSLDEISAEKFLEDIRELSRKGGIIFIALHDLAALKNLCDEIIYLS